MPPGPGGVPGMMPSSQSQGTFSTLNNDVIPDREFLTTIEDYQPKVFNTYNYHILDFFGVD